jgi:hypothetical protein
MVLLISRVKRAAEPHSGYSSPPFFNNMFKLRVLPLVVALSLGSSSCWFRKAKPVRVFVPPPPPPRAPLPTRVPDLPPAPDVKIEASSEVPGVPAEMPAALPPPPAPRRATPPPRAATPPPAVTPETATPAPRLGQIFSAEQSRDYNRTLDESLERVRRTLAQVSGRNLNADLRDMVARIQTFQKQAEQAREQDLVTAVNLARRADVLAQDLLKRLP